MGNAEVLANRFKITYDTRTKAGPKKLQSANRGKTTRTGNVGFRSKNPTNYLYGKVGKKDTTWWGKFGGNQSRNQAGCNEAVAVVFSQNASCLFADGVASTLTAGNSATSLRAWNFSIISNHRKLRLHSF